MLLLCWTVTTSCAPPTCSINCGRWETAYGDWLAQQFATALEGQGVEVKKRRLDGQPVNGSSWPPISPPHSTPNSPNPSDPRPVRAEAGGEAVAPAGAHTSPPCPATAPHLTSGKADNPSEADQHQDPENSPFQRRGWGTPACLAVALETPAPTRVVCSGANPLG